MPITALKAVDLRREPFGVRFRTNSSRGGWLTDSRVHHQMSDLEWRNSNKSKIKQMITNEHWDLFICHASADKDLVRPLAVALNSLGVEVWYDEFSLELGDSLSQSIDKGLSKSKYGLVVISPAFIGKGWTEYELKGLVTKEIGGPKVILPIWHGVTVKDVKELSLPLADKLAFKTDEQDIEDIIFGILKVVRPDIYEATPRSDLERISTGAALRELKDELEFVKSQIDSCPECGAELRVKTQVPSYGEWPDTDAEITRYACGYAELDGNLEHPCSKSANYPTLNDYDLVTEYQEQHSQWMCYARPKTEMAKLVHLRGMPGKTEEQAKQRVIEASKSYLTKY